MRRNPLHHAVHPGAMCLEKRCDKEDQALLPHHIGLGQFTSHSSSFAAAATVVHKTSLDVPLSTPCSARTLSSKQKVLKEALLRHAKKFTMKSPGTTRDASGNKTAGASSLMQ